MPGRFKFFLMQFLDQLKGGDLRSLGQSNEVVKCISTQQSFNELFKCIFYPDRVVAMRSMDAVEKVTLVHPEYLQQHSSELFQLLDQAQYKEFKWHLPLLIVRLSFSKVEAGKVWEKLTNWALDQNESKIVRVNSIQALYYLLKQYPDLRTGFNQTLKELEKTDIPSIKARLKQFKP